MKFAKNISLLVLVVIIAYGCKKDTESMPGVLQQPRTANIFGFPLTSHGCQLVKLTDPAGDNTNFIYSASGLLEKMYESYGAPTADTTKFFYDASNRLTRILPLALEEQWDLQYTGNETRVSKIKFKDLFSGFTDSILVSYPAASKVLFTFTSLPTVVETLSIDFDNNHNPIGSERKTTVTATGVSTTEWTIATTFNNAVINPLYPYAYADYSYFRDLGVGYEGTRPLAGHYFGTHDIYTDNIDPSNNFDITFTPGTVNSNGYPQSFVVAQAGSGSATLQLQYNCP